MKKKSENIYIQAPRILKDNSIIKILLKYKEWIDRAIEIKTHLNVDIKKDIEYNDNLFIIKKMIEIRKPSKDNISRLLIEECKKENN